MTGRKSFAAAMTAFAFSGAFSGAFAGALGGCSSAPEPNAASANPVVAPTRSGAKEKQDVEFVRGCWVATQAPGGQVVSFLRLLPMTPDAPNYTGAIATAGPSTGSRVVLSFSRDGVAAVVDRQGTPIGARDFVHDPATWQNPPGGRPKHLATFVRTNAADPTVLIVEGGEESLRIFTAVEGSDSRLTLFEGQRDGCD